MDKESANWCRFAQLIINKGGKVLRGFLVVEIVTSIFTNYSQHWKEHVQNPEALKYSTDLWFNLKQNISLSDHSSKNILKGLLYSLKKARQDMETTVKEEAERLKQWRNDIERELINSVSIDVKTILNSWLLQIQQEILKLDSVCTVLSQWDETFIRHLYSAQHSLLLEIEESDRFISRCSCKLTSLSPLSSSSTFQQLVQAFKKDLKIWEERCFLVLSLFEQGCNALIISGKAEAQGLQGRDALAKFLDDFKATINKENIKSNVDFFCGEWYSNLKKVFERYEKMTREGDSTSAVLTVAQTLREELEKLEEVSFTDYKIRNFFQKDLDLKDLELLDKELAKLKDISIPADLQKLDLTLLIVILRKSDFVHSPLPHRDADSYDLDTSMSANIQRLRSHRNNVIAHIEETKISSDIFENFWKEVKMLLCKIASRCGGNFETIISREIDEMKNAPLEPHRVSELKQKFITWLKNDIQVESPAGFRYLESIQRAEQNFCRGGQEMVFFELPATWAKMAPGENLKVVNLWSTDEEYKDVQQQFLQSVGECMTIVKLERIQNRTLYLQYEAKKQLMEQTNPGHQNESRLWHGTSADAVDSINIHGFNRSYSGRFGNFYGRGVYFATNARFSATYSKPDLSGNKRVYLCNVLTGQYTVGTNGMRIPPAKPGCYPYILYDSVVDNTTNPKLFAIFSDTQAIPKYLITFK